MVEEPMVVDFPCELGRKGFGNLFDGAPCPSKSMCRDVHGAVGSFVGLGWAMVTENAAHLHRSPDPTCSLRRLSAFRCPILLLGLDTLSQAFEGSAA